MRGQSSSTEPENRPATTKSNTKTAAGRYLAAGSIITALAATGAGLSAQENGGLEMTFGIRSELRATDNAELTAPSAGDATFFDTTLSFGLRSVTRRSKLELDLSGVARFADLPAGSNGSNGFEAPSARLAYVLDNQSSLLKFNANWQQTDLSYLSPINDPVLALDDAGDLVLVNDPGQRTRYSYGASIETGRTAPLGLTLAVSQNGFDYKNTLSASYYDSKRTRITGKLRLTLAPDTEAFMRVLHADFEADNAAQTRRKNRNLSFGLTHEMDAATTIEGSIGYSKVTTDTTGGRNISDGLIAEASATRQMQNGSAGLSYEHAVYENGSRNSLKVQRDLELPRGALSFDLGVSKSTYSDTNLIGSVTYRQGLPMGMFSLSLARSVSTDADNQDLLATRLNAGWQYELSALSSLSLNAGLIRVENDGTGATATRDRTNLSVAYNHALTDDWLMSTGVEVRTSQTAGQPQARSNAIFFSLEREFSIRP
ncbi:MAG: hypothetical protein ACRBBV_04780 [Paracoccaceae bacterium]